MRTRTYSLFLIVTVLLILFGPVAVLAQEPYVYWIGSTDPDQTQGTTLFRVSVEDAQVDTLFYAHSPEHPRYLYDLAIDTVHNRIYWTDSGPEGFIGAIMRAPLEGGAAEVAVGGIVCGTGGPSGIALDPSEGRIYWGEVTDCYDVGVSWTDLEGSFIETLPVDESFAVGAIALDIPNQVIYWTNERRWPDQPVGIFRANLDGTGMKLLLQRAACDIALAHAQAKIYWTECSRKGIMQANLDGTGVEEVIGTEGTPVGMALDEAGGTIYWTEQHPGKLSRANLDGTNAEDLLTDLVVPASLALSFGKISTDVEGGEEMPGGAVLRGAYPNPVRGSTMIAFRLPQPAHVKLEIYDLLGRRVDGVTAQTYPAGSFSLAWHPEGLASGVYFCRMATASGVETIRLVVQQ